MFDLATNNSYEALIDVYPPTEELIIIWLCVFLGVVYSTTLAFAIAHRMRDASGRSMRPFIRASKVSSLLIVILICLLQAIQLTALFALQVEVGGTQPDGWELSFALSKVGVRLFWIAGALSALVVAMLIEWSVRKPASS